MGVRQVSKFKRFGNGIRAEDGLKQCRTVSVDLWQEIKKRRVSAADGQWDRVRGRRQLKDRATRLRAIPLEGFAIASKPTWLEIEFIFVAAL
jgi:hypothetical protein